jgi:hypothetical protein
MSNNKNPVQYFVDQNTNDKQIEITGTHIALTKDLLSSSPITALLSQNGIQVGSNISTWQNLSLLDDVLASVEYPPNQETLKLNNTLVLDDGSGPTTTANNTQITLDNNLNNISTLTSDNLMLRDSGYSIVNELHNNKIQIVDNNSNMQIELNNDSNVTAEPIIRFQNTLGSNNLIKYSGIYANSNNCFNLDNSTKFLKQNNPFSFNYYRLNDGDYIEKYYPFVYCFNISAIKLYSPSEYLDDNGNAGWSCLISNHSGNDFQIDTAGYDWYSHSHAQQANPIILKKFATCRITLIYNSDYGTYFYAVSEF